MVVLSLGVLAEDALGAIASVMIIAAGVVVEIAVGRALLDVLGDLF